MKFNYILAVLGFIFGLGGALAAYSFSGLSADLMTNGSITLVSSILGLIGIYLFEKDYKIAVIQYIICGLGVLIGTSLFGLLGFIFFILAAILAYVEKDKSGNNANKVDNVHFYGDENQVRQNYQNFSTNSSKNSLLWAIPVVSLMIIILVGVFGGLSYQNDIQTKGNGITISDIRSDLQASYGYYTGGVKGTLTSEKDLDNVQVKGVWYSEDGTQLDQTYDTSILNDIKSGRRYQLDIPYFEDSDKKPAKVEIQVFESFSDEPLYTQTVNFN